MSPSDIPAVEHERHTKDSNRIFISFSWNIPNYASFVDTPFFPCLRRNIRPTWIFPSLTIFDLGEGLGQENTKGDQATIFLILPQEHSPISGTIPSHN
jgi:hypothetical protein